MIALCISIRLSFSYSRHSAPTGWERCVAPEGNVYFYHEGMVRVLRHPILPGLTKPWHQRVFTHADMDDMDQALWIQNAVKELQRRRSQITRELPRDTDTVIDYKKGYYLTSWSSKYIFWLEKVSAEVITKGSRSAFANTRTSSALEHEARLSYICRLSHVKPFLVCHR